MQLNFDRCTHHFKVEVYTYVPKLFLVYLKIISRSCGKNGTG